jgi:hypothetical protein
MYDYDEPFAYNRILIEKVNRIMLDKHSNNERYKKVAYECFNFINPNSLREGHEKGEEYFTRQIEKFFEQYTKYISRA